MRSKDQRLQGWPLDLRSLRAAGIVLPLLFLIAVDLLRHTIFFGQLHTFSGFFGTYTVTALAVVVFSFSIFSFITKLQNRIVDQNRQLSALNDIAKAAAAKPRLEELLEASLDLILSNMKADAGLICLVDLEREEHSAVSHRGFSEEMARRLQRAKFGNTPIALKVVRTGQPVVWEHVFEDPQVAERTRREGMKSGITAPLKSEGQVNGLLAIASRAERHFSSTDREFLEGIGGQLGMAIRNASLYEQSETQNRELSALIAVGKAATSTFDLGELLEKSLDVVIELTPADAAEVWLREGEELALRCHRGAHREAFLEQTRFQVGQGFPGIVAQRRETLVVHNLPDDPRFLRQDVVKAGFHTFCALPLRYQDKLVGVLAVAALSPEAIQEAREIRLLESIGEWLALSIESTRLYQQVQEIAVVQERERLAREMHDGTAQLLGYINTQTMAVKRLLSSERLGEAQEELTKIEAIARDLYADVREGILGLRIAARRQDGLLPALREYVERYREMSGVTVELDAEADDKSLKLSDAVEIQLIRIVQEALTNVRKHSKASLAKVSFQRSSGDLRVTILDNGRGFDLARLPSTGWPRFGLQTMRERAEAVEGTVNIQTAPGKGTKVEVRVPLLRD